MPLIRLLLGDLIENGDIVRVHYALKKNKICFPAQYAPLAVTQFMLMVIGKHTGLRKYHGNMRTFELHTLRKYGLK